MTIPGWAKHPIFIVSFMIIMSWIYASLIRTEQKMRISTESVSILDQEVDQIASEIYQLEEELKLATSSTAKEKRIRDELLMKKPGEYIVQLPLLESREELETETSNISIWDEWVELIIE